MEMSGNLSEFVVGIGNSEMRAYTGMHGDGTLTSTGLSNVANVPLSTISQRSFGYTSTSNSTALSRRYSNLTSVTTRFNSFTARLTRTQN